MEISPIGYYRSQDKYKYDTPRQGVFNEDHEGVIELERGNNFEQALIELNGFNFIWLIYGFHLNPHWKPMVRPPRGSEKKIGVFATRAPYRPNPIGISCVELLSIENLVLKVRQSDLLDGTPIFDIKPYLVYADSRPDAKQGWLSTVDLYKINYSVKFLKCQQWLIENGGPDLRTFIQTQLEYEPNNGRFKRVYEKNADEFVLAYRTWRVQFHIDNSEKFVEIDSLVSGYSLSEVDSQDDPYKDKDLHRKFNLKFLTRSAEK